MHSLLLSTHTLTHLRAHTHITHPGYWFLSLCFAGESRSQSCILARLSTATLYGMWTFWRREGLRVKEGGSTGGKDVRDTLLGWGYVFTTCSLGHHTLGCCSETINQTPFTTSCFQPADPQNFTQLNLFFGNIGAWFHIGFPPSPVNICSLDPMIKQGVVFFVFS